MPNYTEIDIQNALQEVHEGVPVRTAAGRHGIPVSTLRGRISGAQSHTESHEHFQKLSAEQEKHLATWIIAQDDLGFAPSHAQVIDFAGRIARLNGNEEPIGVHWMDGFLRRNEGIKTLRGQRLDSARFNGATIENIKGFFPHLAVPVVKEIKQENRHNMDEMGIMEGLGYNSLVLGRAEKTRTIVQNPGSTDWTTIIECISAIGKALTPLVIYKGQTVQQSWFPEDPHFLDFLKDWDFTCSQKGWTNNQIATLWLKKIFIPKTKPAKEGDKRLLIIDGHGSHITDEFMFECFWNDIHILYLIPHSSHVLQPLDLAVFGPIKQRYRRLISSLSSIQAHTPIGKCTFLRCYYEARKAGMTAKNILAGWKASGLWPVSIAKPLMNPMTTALPETPKTPQKRARSPSPCLFKTPTSSRELRASLESIPSASKLDGAMRLFMGKIAKDMDRKNLTLASQERELILFRQEREEMRPKRRKKVPFDPNQRFAKVPDIDKARQEMLKLLKPRETSEKVRKWKKADLFHEWQLEITEMPDLVFS
jgi:4-hydroxybenzoate polyprenyltransferase